MIYLRDTLICISFLFSKGNPMKKLLSILLLISVSNVVSAASYIVKPDDTLLGIANRHSVTYSQSMQANPDLNREFIKAGITPEENKLYFEFMNRT